MTHYEAVVEFMQLMGQDVLTEPTEPTSKLGILRYNLIAEEVEELAEAMENDDYVEIADALADILYVGFGAYAAFGLQPGQLYHEKYIKDHEQKVATLLPMSKAVYFNKQYTNNLRVMMEGLGEGKLGKVHHALDKIVDLSYQVAYLSGIDIMSCFKEVHDSNMSKACLTRVDAENSLKMRKEDPATAAKYEDAEVHQVGERFILRRKADGKVLKGQHYFDPNLKQFLNM